MQKSFDEKAGDWDKKQNRINNNQKIAKGIRDGIELKPHYRIIDFGVGTGLLSGGIAPHVNHILGIDTSAGMIKEFLAKDWPCSVDAKVMDMSNEIPDGKYDGIISSMSLHHVENIEKYFAAFNTVLNKDGFIALADLVTEDGSFHSSGNEGIYYFGFDFVDLDTMLKQAGFYDIRFKIVNTIEKELASGENKGFPIFLVTAKKK